MIAYLRLMLRFVRSITTNENSGLPDSELWCYSPTYLMELEMRFSVVVLSILLSACSGISTDYKKPMKALLRSQKKLSPLIAR